LNLDDNCNIPKDYYLKINIKINKCFNSHLDKNPNAGKFQFIKKARQKLINKFIKGYKFPKFAFKNKLQFIKILALLPY